MKTSWQKVDRLLLAIAAVCYAVFAGWLTVRNYPWQTGDTPHYLELAQALKRGVFGVVTGSHFEPEAWRQPGYPAFLALVSAVASSTATVIVLQHLLILISIVLMFVLLRRHVDVQTARMFLLATMVYPFLADSAARLMPEALCLFLLTCCIFAMCSEAQVSPLFVGVLAASLGLVRPNLVLLPLVCVIAYALAGRLYARKAVVTLVTATLLLSLWAYRNHRQFARFSPLPPASGAGSVLMFAAWETRLSSDSLFQYGRGGVITPEMRRSGMLELQAEINSRVATPRDRYFLVPDSYDTNQQKIAADKILTAEALRMIAAAPGAYAWRTLLNLPRIWFSAAVKSSMPARQRYAMVAVGLTMFVLAVWGWCRLLPAGLESRHPLLSMLLLIPLYFTGTLCWFQHEARYTIPARVVLLAVAAVPLASFAAAFHLGQRETVEEVSRTGEQRAKSAGGVQGV
ncbi:MAG: hypothetical protein ACR2IF_19265 [Terriglobales bacterium]